MKNLVYVEPFLEFVILETEDVIMASNEEAADNNGSVGGLFGE